MTKGKIDFDVVRRIAMGLPDVEDSTIHGAPSLKVRGRLLTCPALHKSAEPDSLAVRIDVDQRTALLAADSDTYYVTDHYVNHSFLTRHRTSRWTRAAGACFVTNLVRRRVL